MAQINLERKRRSTVPWLLALLALVLLLWYLFARNADAGPQVQPADSARAATVEPPAAPAAADSVAPGGPDSGTARP